MHIQAKLIMLSFRVPISHISGPLMVLAFVLYKYASMHIPIFKIFDAIPTLFFVSLRHFQ